MPPLSHHSQHLLVLINPEAHQILLTFIRELNLELPLAAPEVGGYGFEFPLSTCLVFLVTSPILGDGLGNSKGFRNSVPGTRDKDHYLLQHTPASSTTFSL